MFGRDGIPLVDLLAREDGDAVPMPQEAYLCRHPSDDTKQVRVKPTTVIPLLSRVWLGKNYVSYCEARGVKPDLIGIDPTALRTDCNLRCAFPSLTAIREFSRVQLASVREDHKRPLNPTPYKVLGP